MQQVTKIVWLLFFALAISAGINPTKGYSAEKIEAKIYQLMEISAGTTRSNIEGYLDKMGSTLTLSLTKANPVGQGVKSLLLM